MSAVKLPIKNSWCFETASLDSDSTGVSTVDDDDSLMWKGLEAVKKAGLFALTITRSKISFQSDPYEWDMSSCTH
jgi:hypothetical protein